MNLSRNFMNLWGKKVVFIHSKFLKSMLLSSKQLCVTICSSLTHFSSNFHFSTPYKCQNAYGFLAFLWGAEMEHWQWFPYFESIIYNHFRNILKQILLSPQVERCLIIIYKHGIYELLHELLNDLTLRILGN